MAPKDYFLQNDLVADNLELVAKRSINEVYLSTNYVLKIPRAETRDWVDPIREAELALKAIERRIKTPKPIAWGADYTIWERVKGEIILAVEVSDLLIKDLLDTLERIQQNPFEPVPEIVEPWWQGDESNVDNARKNPQFSRDEIEKIESALLYPTKTSTPTYVHGDVYADNLFADAQGNFAAIIDWGNAGWKTLERECAFMDQSIFVRAIARWKEKLDMNLLWKMRLNLMLEILPRGVVSVDVVKDALNQL